MEKKPTSSPSNHSWHKEFSINIRPPSLGDVKLQELQLVKSFGKEQTKMEENPTCSSNNHSDPTMAFISFNIPPSLDELRQGKLSGKEQKKMEEKATSSQSNHCGDTNISIFDMLKQPSDKISSELSQRFEEQSESTIYRVHGHFTNINYKAYEPEIIAIGPYHRCNDNLKMMEDHKWRYLSLLCEGKKEKFDEYCSNIEPLEKEARKCYADPIGLDKDEFVGMLVLDGCFIIELVRKVMRKDPITRVHWIMRSLKRDLMLFENQIPFFILCRLFKLIEDPDQPDFLSKLKLWDYLLTFFQSIIPRIEGGEIQNRLPSEIKHLLHLIRIELVSSFELDLAEGVEYKMPRLEDKSAARLAEANVQFKRNKKTLSLFDIQFECGTLILPPLTIDNGTESLFRNLIAYEQYFHDTHSSHVTDRYRCVTDYVFFFDCLINSSEDVEILSRFGIIKNCLGNDEGPAEIFNKLMDSIAILDANFIYGEIFDKVEKHCSKRWNRWRANLNRWMAKLMRGIRMTYFNSTWATISITAAAVLLFLTVAQTVFAALSR